MKMGIGKRKRAKNGFVLCLLATAHGVPFFRSHFLYFRAVGSVCFAVNFYFYLFYMTALCV